MDDDQWRGVGNDDDDLVISTDLIKGLGDELSQLADTLQSEAEDAVPVPTRGFAFYSAGDELGRILRDYEQHRHQLCEGLRQLSALAAAAGEAYFDAETVSYHLSGGRG